MKNVKVHNQNRGRKNYKNKEEKFMESYKK